MNTATSTDQEPIQLSPREFFERLSPDHYENRRALENTILDMRWNIRDAVGALGLLIAESADGDDSHAAEAGTAVWFLTELQEAFEALERKILKAGTDAAEQQREVVGGAS